MKRYLVFTLAALVLSAPSFARRYEEATVSLARVVAQPATVAAQPLRVRFDDDGFAYYGNKEGFIQLSSDASGLVLHLRNDNARGVWYGFEKVDNLSRKDYNRIYEAVNLTDSFVAQRRAQAEEAKRLLKLVNVTQRPADLSVVHQRTDLGSVLAAYLAEFAALGFEVQAELQAPNVRVYNVAKDARQARVTFTQHGNDIRVRIAGFAY